MQQFDLNDYPHRRKNILTEEWILVSPHRTKRSWQRELSISEKDVRQKYDPQCYLCPGNKRANGDVNPNPDKPEITKNKYQKSNKFSEASRKLSGHSSMHFHSSILFGITLRTKILFCQILHELEC